MGKEKYALITLFIVDYTIVIDYKRKKWKKSTNWCLYTLRILQRQKQTITNIKYKYAAVVEKLLQEAPEIMKSKKNWNGICVLVALRVGV